MTKTYTIRPLPYSNFTNREFESLMTDSHQVLTSFAKSYKDEAMYDDHLEVFDSKLEQFQAQLASVENKQTLSLAEVDKERDSALVGLFTLHRGFAKIKEPNLKAAHETLTPVLAKYKDITKHTNDVATAEIKSLLKTLKEEPYDAAVTTLGLLPMLTAVATAQEDYDRAEALARTAKSSKEVGKTKQLRPKSPVSMTSLCAIPQPPQKPIPKNSTLLNSSKTSTPSATASDAYPVQARKQKRNQQWKWLDKVNPLEMISRGFLVVSWYNFNK